MTVAMMWTLAFIPNFTIGGVTGVMLAMAAADYQYHNSYFLVAHFHYVLIAATVFACFAGLHYWYPKMMGYILNEKLGKIAFWFWVIGFNICFIPQFFLGLDGMTRRMYTYAEGLGWTGLNQISTVGAALMGIGFLVMCYNFYYSHKNKELDLTGDPWDGRTLEWATLTPIPHYNFSKVPEAEGLDWYWYAKKRGESARPTFDEVKPVHMPNNTANPIITSMFFGISGFGLIFEYYPLAILGAIGIIVGLIVRSFDYNDGHYVQVEEIVETEKIKRGEK